MKYTAENSKLFKFIKSSEIETIPMTPEPQTGWICDYGFVAYEDMGRVSFSVTEEAFGNNELKQQKMILGFNKLLKEVENETN